MNFDEMLQLHVLKRKAALSGISGRLLDHVIEEHPEATRQMCAKVAPGLLDALEAVCDVLDFTKREFIEAAVSDAVLKAEEHIAKMGDELAQRELGEH